MAQTIITLQPHTGRAFKNYMAEYGAREYIRIHQDDLRQKRPTETLTCEIVFKGVQHFEPPTPEQIYWAKLRAGQIIICSDCGDAKESHDFFRDARKRNGLYSECKNCHRKRDRERKWALRNVAVGKAA